MDGCVQMMYSTTATTRVNRRTAERTAGEPKTGDVGSSGEGEFETAKGAVN
jgi:hypothetical protein